jgi:glycosyltransferase involved in cell wall biosynthesis
MRNWLILSTVDLLRSPNNREHHLIEHLAGRFDRVWVVFRRQPGRGSLFRGVLDSIVPYSIETRRGNVIYAAVNQPLNHYVGMIRELTGQNQHSRSGWRADALRLAAAAIGPLGVAKDVSTVLSLAAFARMRCEGCRNVFCTAMGPWAAAAARILRRLGVVGPLLYEDRDYEVGFVQPGLRQRWIKWMENSSIRASDGCVSIGERLAMLRLDECQRHSVTIPTGVRYADFRRNPWAAREPVLAYTGNIADWARLDLVVQALALIRTKVHGARLEILGSGLGNAVPEVLARAERCGIPSAISILPPRPNREVGDFLGKAAIGCAISDRGPLRVYAAPLKLFEYMAAGVPVLATSETEAGDIVTRHDCGIAIEPTVEAVAEACLRLLSDPALAGRLGENGCRAAAGHDWSKIMEREWSVMLEIAGAYPRSSDQRGSLNT